MFLLSLFVFICHNFFICCSLLIYIYICTCGASPCLSPRVCVCVCVFVIVSFFFLHPLVSAHHTYDL
ncbi:hypothetical protein, unlikely [Trypanosoma brucei brucei TREU927]|uniref:Uncharacterized protein n=1 Tax=Trypanosoma brucei brucei (strain 927/4 GUTat10.1) TaxID=185431 RepID=Q38FP5_TRYB2|nr:hypothetical protein, unlikely [Trypanosoma brucei brucei TREU927]EAN76375.1 hypothetical protein, unlikely [Trypanosoma brucei brucei TREU927]